MVVLGAKLNVSRFFSSQKCCQPFVRSSDLLPRLVGNRLVCYFNHSFLFFSFYKPLVLLYLFYIQTECNSF